ncbi:MAG: 16S rRNA (adenine(1518)-N(6)/adenine(1519)-N(6))-dimethyltransferase RsmA [Clostridia bacterium]|nr:16S rRNA (adenine(1518)-N(6)/adenine(1519)-N(6))-dimethyltransferase RsmA [Clostridia bacterium]MDD4047730.1 16S rRNA (adenine(1518)-N(6)/adenine(1519)-N(6))-dimethyltransferase RsmA [Clostridia bacterium]
MPEEVKIKMRDILKEQGFHYKKKWGQNFIFDNNLLKRIVEAAGVVSGDRVVEIGPGAGTLTNELIKKSAQILVVEIDPTLIPILEDVLQDDNVVIVQGDALKINMDELTKANGFQWPYKVVANLPYYITTPLIMGLLESKYQIEDIVVMVQKEVADRLTASPDTKEYGAVTIAVRYYSQPEVLFNIPRQVFRPIPEVDSALIRLKPRKIPPVQVQDEKLMFRIIKGAFGQRRKTLLNSLLSVKPEMKKEDIKKILEKAGINSNTRGEALSLEQFAEIANLWSNV